MKEPDKNIVLDLNRDRIKTVILAAYEISQEFLETDFLITAEQLVAQINPYLDSNRVTIPVQLDLPSKRYPNMRLDIDLRRQKIFARLFPKEKQAQLNHMLKGL
jgi:hypothetical protein